MSSCGMGLGRGSGMTARAVARSGTVSFGFEKKISSRSLQEVPGAVRSFGLGGSPAGVRGKPPRPGGAPQII
jgi:hypothetical protein